MKPQPHQLEAVNKNTDGLLLFHGLGSGKTYTSLLASEDSPTVAVVPASLRENYKKEILKAGKRPEQYAIVSYEKMSKEQPDGDVLILDEAHKISNPASLRTKAILESAGDYKKRIAMTATPIVNHPYDLVPIARFLDPSIDEKSLPKTKREFENKFIENYNPGFLSRLVLRKKPETNIKNEKLLRSYFKDRVHHYEAGKENYPEVVEEYVDVPMTKKQEKVYHTVAGKANPIMARKIRKNMDLSKKEMSNLNFFLSAVRQASNSTDKFGINENTPKIKRLLDDFIEDYQRDPNFKGVVYSNYLDSGLAPVAKRFSDAGVPYGVYTGKLNDKEKKKLIDDYNSDKIKGLLISSAGSEGLDLKGTKSVQVMEPHWNNNKLRQVIGRAARYKSHDHLPEGERNVKVRHYRASLSRGTSADQYLNNMSIKKDNVNNKFLEMLKTAYFKHGCRQ